MQVWLVDRIDIDEDSYTIAVCATEERAHQAVEEDKGSYRLRNELYPHLANKDRYAVYDVELLT